MHNNNNLFKHCSKWNCHVWLHMYQVVIKLLIEKKTIEKKEARWNVSNVDVLASINRAQSQGEVVCVCCSSVCQILDLCLAYGTLVVHNNMNCEWVDSRIKRKENHRKEMDETKSDQ